MAFLKNKTQSSLSNCISHFIGILILLNSCVIAADSKEFSISTTAAVTSTEATFRINGAIPPTPDTQPIQTVIDFTYTALSPGFSYYFVLESMDATAPTSFSFNSLANSSSTLTYNVGATPGPAGPREKNFDWDSASRRLKIIHRQTGGFGGHIVNGEENWKITISGFKTAPDESYFTFVLKTEQKDPAPATTFTEIVTPATEFVTTPVPVIDFAPLPLNFDPTTVGEINTSTLTIKNNSDGTANPANLRVTNLSLTTGINFSVGSASFLILPGGSPHSIPVTFSPSISLSPGLVNDDLTLTLDGDYVTPPTSTLTLTGTARKIDLVFCLDISGSMHYTPNASNHHAPSPSSRMDHVTSALSTFQPLLQSHAEGKGKMALVVFPGEPAPSPPPGTPGPPYASKRYPTTSSLTDISPAEIGAVMGTAGVGGLDPHLHHGRGTPMSDGLNMAADLLITEPSVNKKVIFLLTDGKHNTASTGTPIPENLVDDPTDRIRDGNIKIFALGYGVDGSDDVNLNLLDNYLAANTGGRFRAFDDTAWPIDPVGDTFPKFLNRIFAEGFDLAVAIAPRSQISSTEVNTHSVFISEFDRETSFVLSWITPNSRQLFFSLKAPDGTIINSDMAAESADISYFNGPTYKIYTIQPNFLHSKGRLGKWVMEIKANFADSAHQEDYAYDVMMQSGLKLNTTLDKNIYYTGSDIEFVARLTANGLGIDGAKVFVEVRRPEEGAGNWHHSNQVDIETLNTMVLKDSMPDLMSDKFRKASYLINQLNIDPPSTNISLPDVQLGNIGNGYYRGKLSGEPNGTTKIGTYTFRIIAEGETNSGNQFSREQLIQKYISALPDPDLTDLQIQYVEDKDDMTIYKVKVVPRDKFGNYFGPGEVDQIELTSTNGQLVEELDDDLNGGYDQTLRVFSDEEKPTIKTTISKVPMRFVQPDVAPGKLSPFAVSIYNGFVWFDKKLGIDRGMLTGVQLSSNLSPWISMLAEFGAVVTQDNAERHGTVIISGGSLALNFRNARTKSIIPYTVAGVGIYRFDGFGENEQTLTYNVGGGIRFKLSKMIEGQIETRDYIVTSNNFRDETTHNPQSVWGIKFSF